jgi:uncharacterized protein (TIGR02611 family)
MTDMSGGADRRGPGDDNAGEGKPVEGAPEDFRERLREAALEAEFESGRREETAQEARASVHRRLARMVVGFALLFTGVLLLVLPGPGWLCIAAGLGILSRDVAWADRALQRVRRRLPQDSEGKVSKPVIVTSVFLALAGIAGSIWFMLR